MKHREEILRRNSAQFKVVPLVNVIYVQIFNNFLPVQSGLDGDRFGGFAEIVVEQHAAHVEVYEFDHVLGNRELLASSS